MISYSLRRSALQIQSGFSLVELLTGLTVTGVLGSLTIGISNMVSSHAVTAELNGLMADMAFARSAAITRRQTTTICASNNGSHCNKESAWEQGWIIFTDENRDRLRDPDDQLLRVQGPLSKGTLLDQGSGYYYYMMYRPTGMVYPNATFAFCNGPHYRRAIIIFRSGRARVSTVSSSGDALSCEDS
ncbi:MAG: GspH/FimT family pseudopilin [Acidiferrobacterales bacterium]